MQLLDELVVRPLRSVTAVRVAALLAAAMAITGCDRGTPTAVPPVGEGLQVSTPTREQTSLAQETITDSYFAKRFGLTVRASGSFRPGTPVSLDVELRANLATSSVDVDVSLPDLDLSRVKGYRRRAPSGQRPSQSHWQAALAKSAVRHFTSTLSFPEPGLYQVLVRAQAANGTPDIAGPDLLQNTSAVSTWLWIASSGGGTRERFDASLISDNYRTEPGPLRMTTASAADCDPNFQVCDGPCDPTTTNVCPSALTIGGTVYWSRNGTWTPLPFAKVRVSGSNGPTTIADQKGNYRLDYCPSPSMGVTVELATDHDDVRVESHWATGVPSDVIGQAYVRDVDCYGGINIYAYDNIAAEFFDSMLENVRQSRALFANTANRGKIVVWMRNDTTNLGQYEALYDRIDVTRDIATGTQGIFTGAHEYGHAVHHKALGGLTGGPQACPKPHYFWSRMPIECAATEGFADFHMVMTRGPAIGGAYQGIHDNIWIDSPANNYATDGSAIESAVAAFLVDFVDPIGPDLSGGVSFYDPIQASASYIASIIRQCEIGVNNPTQYKRANGVDYWFYCMDRQLGSGTIKTKQGITVSDPTSSSNYVVDPWLRDNWFFARNDYPRTDTPYKWRPLVNAAANTDLQRRLMFADLYVKFTAPFSNPNP